MRTSLRPARHASSTTYWMAGLSTTGIISLGCALEAGRNRVPRPAAGMTALVTGGVAMTVHFYRGAGGRSSGNASVGGTVSSHGKRVLMVSRHRHRTDR